MKEKSIVAFSPELPNTPGWNELSREKQDRMLEITSRLLQFQSMEGLGVVGQCVELENADRELEGEPMNITDYTQTVFKQGFRTAWRRKADFREFLAILPKENSEQITKTLAEKGAMLLRGAAGGGMKELIGAFSALKSEIPKTKDPKVIEGFIEKKIRPKLRERRQERTSKSKPEPLEKNLALRIWFNTTLRIMKQAKIRNTEQLREWLQTGVGYVMQARAIPGSVHTGRQDIPEGFVTRRGPKPKKNRLGKAAVILAIGASPLGAWWLYHT
ncbi:MAG TPA: hypothetical protein VN666_22050, partial [Nitrospira sp.]|nr:hypothetical protein [Nitrospira sp.]